MLNCKASKNPVLLWASLSRNQDVRRNFFAHLLCTHPLGDPIKKLQKKGMKCMKIKPSTTIRMISIKIYQATKSISVLLSSSFHSLKAYLQIERNTDFTNSHIRCFAMASLWIFCCPRFDTEKRNSLEGSICNCIFEFQPAIKCLKLSNYCYTCSALH